MSINTKKQIAQAKELLKDSGMGFVKGLFNGQILSDQLPDYPHTILNTGKTSPSDLLKYCQEYIDPYKIDHDAEIPRDIIKGLGELGVLGWSVPKVAGGLEQNQQSYCLIMEILGGHCSSTSVFVNAHHSIGCRALVLFGTKEQQETWLPKLVTGEHLAAFALTEPKAGSDAANVQTMATPVEGGYRLNGEKRYITNGSIANVLTVMARTPVENSSDTKVTAFLVTPDMERFEVVEAAMEKCGIRGTTTSRLKFNNMFVPDQNILGTKGQGLKVALTVLNFGRTTFGATCTGAAKYCVGRAVFHAKNRVQFGQPLIKFDLIKEKLSYMAAATYAMECCTYQTAALMDNESSDFMLETAILKVFNTDELWKIVNETLQIFGGQGYFSNEPFERMMRDARINMIGEGANEVLRQFIAGVGIGTVGKGYEKMFEDVKKFRLGEIVKFICNKVYKNPKSNKLDTIGANKKYTKHVKKLSYWTDALILKHRENIINKQFQLTRLGDIAINLYVWYCIMQRMQNTQQISNVEKTKATYWIKISNDRINKLFYEMRYNMDKENTKLASIIEMDEK